MPFPRPPVLSPVDAGSPPRLPDRFSAIALMMPFQGGTADDPADSRGQVYAADVTYDWSVQAMRVAAHGVEGKPVDLLFVGAEMYVIDHRADGGLRFFGPMQADAPVPQTDWLAGRGIRCQGRGDVGGIACDWWLGWTPNANGLSPTDPQPPKGTQIDVCNWIWTRADTGLPFRLFFNNVGNPYRLPVLGAYPMTYFTRFEPVDRTQLPKLVHLAQQEAVRVPEGVAFPAPGRGLEDLYDAMHARDGAFMAGAPADGAAGLVEGLKPAAPGAPLPEWSPRMCMTGWTFPTAKNPQFGTACMPIRVFYEDERDQMLTRAWLAVNDLDSADVMDMILHDGATHMVLRTPDGGFKCHGTKPVGPPYRDWAARDRGRPKAVIQDNPVLGPGRTLHITALPSTEGRWFWVWYTPDNDGVLFMEVPQKGNVGLVVTDYDVFDHAPPPFPQDAFEVPAECLKQAAGADTEESA